jgi:flagellum-specific peptidoglycan hydrolase FlgJ
MKNIILLLCVIGLIKFVTTINKPIYEAERAALMVKDSIYNSKRDSTAAATLQRQSPPPPQFAAVASPSAPTYAQRMAEERAKKDDAAILAYVKRFAPTAVAEYKKYGILPSISLAQGILESDAGRSVLAKKANNHFGMKCFSRKCRKGHCMNRTDDTHKDFFVKYDTAWESWRAHSLLLKGKRYEKLYKYGRAYNNWAYGLKKAGYATAKDYPERLIGLIERYKLDSYDW